MKKVTFEENGNGTYNILVFTGDYDLFAIVDNVYEDEIAEAVRLVLL